MGGEGEKKVRFKNKILEVKPSLTTSRRNLNSASMADTYCFQLTQPNGCVPQGKYVAACRFPLPNMHLQNKKEIVVLLSYREVPNDKPWTIASCHKKIIQIIQCQDETPIDGVFTTAKDAYMTPSNPEIVLLHLLNFSSTLVLVKSIPTSHTDLHSRSPSRCGNLNIRNLPSK